MHRTNEHVRMSVQVRQTTCICTCAHAHMYICTIYMHLYICTIYMHLYDYETLQTATVGIDRCTNGMRTSKRGIGIDGVGVCVDA